MFEKITSLQNSRVKDILHLEKPSYRKEKQLFVIEGYREISLAWKHRYSFRYIFYCPEIGSSHEIQELILKIQDTVAVFEVSRQVFEKVAYREGSDGILAVAEIRPMQLEDLKLSANPLIIVLEGVEKPGNLGAILRTADAAGIDGLIVCDPKTDLYNANVVRSSIGCLFTNQVACCTSSEAYTWLKMHQINCYAAALTASLYYHETSFAGPAALVMGTEADGLSEFWLKNCDSQIKIPMSGEIDSLNVSTATAILLFEAKRQRNFKR